MTGTDTAATRPRRPRARRGEGDRLRQEILDATERLLIDTGSEDAVSIRAVADAIGVTPPAIYRHFADKTTLLFEVCNISFQRMDEFIMASAADAGGPLDVLNRRAEAYVRFALDNPEHYRIMFMGRSELTPDQYADVTLVGSGTFAHLVECVEDCIAAGVFRPDLDDAHNLSLALWAAIHGVASLCIAKPNMPGPPPAARLSQQLDLVLHGALRRP